MQQLQWITYGKSHRAVIAYEGGYANLTASKRSFTVEFVSEYLEETVVYSSAAKNLRDAKKLSQAFGYSLLKDSGCDRPSQKRLTQKRFAQGRLSQERAKQTKV